MRVLRELNCPNGLDCPKVHPPRDDGRVPVQGDKADDELRTELGIPDHEDVVLTSPVVLSDVREVLTLAQLGEFVAEHHHRDLFRLETLPHYNAASDSEDYQRYTRGEPAPTAEAKQPWLDRVRREVAAGKAWRRVHAVTHPLPPYVAYEAEWGYVHLAEAGERIRIADLTPALAQVGDFFVLDGEHVVRSRYDADGRFIHAEVMHHDSAAPYVAIAELLWDHAEDFTAWWGARVGYHRDHCVV